MSPALLPVPLSGNVSSHFNPHSLPRVCPLILVGSSLELAKLIHRFCMPNFWVTILVFGTLCE